MFKNRPIAEKWTVAKFGKNGLNDKSDAFRHALFNALNVRKAGEYIAKQFSDAHESEVPNRFIKEKQMDLFNNNIGHGYFGKYPNISNSELADKIYDEMLKGNLVYLTPINTNDPNFNTTHGISASTILTPTNK